MAGPCSAASPRSCICSRSTARGGCTRWRWRRPVFILNLFNLPLSAAGRRLVVGRDLATPGCSACRCSSLPVAAEPAAAAGIGSGRRAQRGGPLKGTTPEHARLARAADRFTTPRSTCCYCGAHCDGPPGPTAVKRTGAEAPSQMEVDGRTRPGWIRCRGQDPAGAAEAVASGGFALDNAMRRRILLHSVPWLPAAGRPPRPPTTRTPTRRRRSRLHARRRRPGIVPVLVVFGANWCGDCRCSTSPSRRRRGAADREELPRREGRRRPVSTATWRSPSRTACPEARHSRPWRFCRRRAGGLCHEGRRMADAPAWATPPSRLLRLVTGSASRSVESQPIRSSSETCTRFHGPAMPRTSIYLVRQKAKPAPSMPPPSPATA